MTQQELDAVRRVVVLTQSVQRMRALLNEQTQELEQAIEALYQIAGQDSSEPVEA